jgi:hypothetical protein
MNPYRDRMLGLVGDRPALASLEATPAKIEALVARIGRGGMSRAYAPGKWTARQIFAHLADAEIASRSPPTEAGSGRGSRRRPVADAGRDDEPF